ncbi:hypothetical protein FQR65_LT17489 [Abscondita terminalis]|nr:hypothetical protein FQR65_LT17489 [Abscondita terminalis]
MRDLIGNYRMILKRREFEESNNESQPLLSSEGSAVSFGAINVDDDSETTDSQTFVTSLEVSTKCYIQKPYSFPKHLGEKDEELVCYAQMNGFGTGDSSILIDSKGFEPPKTQNSMVTIFAIWNTIMGTSLLAMPWGMERAGLFPGILVNVLVAALCLYTCYLMLRINEDHGVHGHNKEVSDLARILLGRWAEILARIFSLVVLIGSLIVYWVLMSNFLYHSVHFFYDYFSAVNEAPSTANQTVICPKSSPNQTSTPVIRDTLFDQAWDLYSTVPIALAVLMFPLLNFKSPTFFTKFNSLGTLSVMYLLTFVAVKSFNWGINMNNWTAELAVKPTFCALSGMLSLSYFIHNIIISIMRSNRHQRHNTRDLSIAFILVTFTYMFIGVVFYICFPLAKSCLEDNILNNFEKFDAMTVIARILLLFQLFTVFPLIAYMLRTDIFKNLSMISCNFSYAKVVAVNAMVVTVCILFACFLPKIGTLIRYTGALSGLVYIFLLPSLMKIASLLKKDALTPIKFIAFISIVIFGFVNLFSQFFIVD